MLVLSVSCMFSILLTEVNSEASSTSDGQYLTLDSAYYNSGNLFLTGTSSEPTISVSVTGGYLSCGGFTIYNDHSTYSDWFTLGSLITGTYTVTLNSGSMHVSKTFEVASDGTYLTLDSTWYDSGQISIKGTTSESPTTVTVTGNGSSFGKFEFHNSGRTYYDWFNVGDLVDGTYTVTISSGALSTSKTLIISSDDQYITVDSLEYNSGSLSVTGKSSQSPITLIITGTYLSPISHTVYTSQTSYSDQFNIGNLVAGTYTVTAYSGSLSNSKTFEVASDGNYLNLETVNYDSVYGILYFEGSSSTSSLNVNISGGNLKIEDFSLNKATKNYSEYITTGQLISGTYTVTVSSGSLSSSKTFEVVSNEESLEIDSVTYDSGILSFEGASSGSSVNLSINSNDQISNNTEIYGSLSISGESLKEITLNKCVRSYYGSIAIDDLEYGSYTVVVTSGSMSSNIDFTVSPDTVSVTKHQGTGTTITSATTATYGTEYYFTVTKETGYDQDSLVVTVTIGGITYIPSVDGDTYTISGTAILGDIIITTNDLDSNTYPVTSIELETESISISIGQGYKMIAVISPNNADDISVTWYSSDTSVATVDDEGNITAISSGTAIIEVTTDDGGYTASCTVTVTENAQTSSPVNGTNWTLIAIGILIVIVIAVLAVYVYKHKTGSKDE